MQVDERLISNEQIDGGSIERNREKGKGKKMFFSMKLGGDFTRRTAHLEDPEKSSLKLGYLSWHTRVIGASQGLVQWKTQTLHDVSREVRPQAYPSLSRP